MLLVTSYGQLARAQRQQRLPRLGSGGQVGRYLGVMGEVIEAALTFCWWSVLAGCCCGHDLRFLCWVRVQESPAVARSSGEDLRVGNSNVVVQAARAVELFLGASRLRGAMTLVVTIHR